MNRSALACSAGLADAVAAARSRLAVAEAELADLCVRYADARIAEEAADPPTGLPPGADTVRPKPGAFVGDELSVVLRRSPVEASRLVARTRRVNAHLPETAAAARDGIIDADQMHAIDQAARRVQDARTLTLLDEQVGTAAATRTPQQLRRWLHRFLTRHEPEAAEHRREVCLSDRRVSIAQSVTGIGYVTGEVSAEDAAAIDGRLSRLAWALGADDPRSEQQRRSDLFAGLLLGTTVVAAPIPSAAPIASAAPAARSMPELLEVESVDPDTGEFLGTRLIALDGDGLPADQPAAVSLPPDQVTVVENRRGPARIGVVVPLSSLLGLDETPGELADRSACVPADVMRELATRPGVLFTRLVVDDAGRLLDLTELGRFPSSRLAEAIRIRAGTCVFPTCQVPAARCDLDHHVPVPRGPTSGSNLDPICRRHHRGKTFAGLAAHRDQDSVSWTMPTAHTYRCVDDPLPLPTNALVSRASSP